MSISRYPWPPPSVCKLAIKSSGNCSTAANSTLSGSIRPNPWPNNNAVSRRGFFSVIVSYGLTLYPTGLIFWLTNWFNTLIFVVVNRRPNSDELILKI